MAFGPYLVESFSAALRNSEVASRVIRQGGHGLIVRRDSTLVLRHDLRQESIGPEELCHYLATIQFRNDSFDVLRMPDEVVMATIGEELLLSHPQSEMWLKAPDIKALLALCDGDATDSDLNLPDWLEASTGGDRVLLSDQRTGRWVLLGRDHLEELRRRVGLLRQFVPAPKYPSAPVIRVKGLEVALQSATNLADALEDFAATGNFSSFEEVTPAYSLTVSLSPQGIELRNSDGRVSLTAREARKWASILRAELQRLRVQQLERGKIRTVFADCEDGHWIMQWGDHVVVPRAAFVDDSARVAPSGEMNHIVRRDDDFLLLLDPKTGSCVALNDLELTCLNERDARP